MTQLESFHRTIPDKINFQKFLLYGIDQVIGKSQAVYS